MPQMAPLWWEVLFMMFIIMFMFMNMMMYFYTDGSNKKSHYIKEIKINQMNWKW